MTDAVLQWSGGKDSALALHRLRERSHLSVVGLQTMFDDEHRRTSWHGVRCEHVAAQAAALDLPLDLVPAPGDVDDYVDRTIDAFTTYRNRGVEYLAVGDVAADDPDTPRETAVEGAGLRSFYPLLGESTADLVREFVDAGFEATVVVVDGTALDERFVGRDVDEAFLADLPADVDDGGEDGEYHTFVSGGPIFEASLDVEVGGVETRTVAGDPHHYGDLRSA